MSEHIILCHENHKNDSHSPAEVSMWLNKLMAIEFIGKEILVKQIQNSKYELICGAGFISIKFFISDEKEKFPFRVRIPVEMTAYQHGKHPIIFLLHVLEGIVHELEVYTADGSLIDGGISIQNLYYDVDKLLKNH